MKKVAMIFLGAVIILNLTLMIAEIIGVYEPLKTTFSIFTGYFINIVVCIISIFSLATNSK